MLRTSAQGPSPVPLIQWGACTSAPLASRTCPAGGRRKVTSRDLRFSTALSSGEWTERRAAPGPPRGGCAKTWYSGTGCEQLALGGHSRARRARVCSRVWGEGCQLQTRARPMPKGKSGDRSHARLSPSEKGWPPARGRQKKAMAAGGRVLPR